MPAESFQEEGPPSAPQASVRPIPGAEPATEAAAQRAPVASPWCGDLLGQGCRPAAPGSRGDLSPAGTLQGRPRLWFPLRVSDVTIASVQRQLRAVPGSGTRMGAGSRPARRVPSASQAAGASLAPQATDTALQTPCRAGRQEQGADLFPAMSSGSQSCRGVDGATSPRGTVTLTGGLPRPCDPHEALPPGSGPRRTAVVTPVAPRRGVRGRGRL